LSRFEVLSLARKVESQKSKVKGGKSNAEQLEMGATTCTDSSDMFMTPDRRAGDRSP
jgi:hypothetical protein